jgi:hypothetical protein
MTHSTSDVEEAVEPRPLWYQRRSGFFSYRWIRVTAFVIYAFFVLSPLVWWALCGSLPSFSTRRLGIVWAMVIALAYPTWAWGETLAFEKWVRGLDPASRKRERAYFKLQSDCAKPSELGL